MRRTTSRPVTCWPSCCGGERGEGDLGDLGARDPRPGASSKTASVYSIGVHAVVADRGDRLLTAGSRRTVTDTSAPARRARHRRYDAVERRVGAQQHLRRVPHGAVRSALQSDRWWPGCRRPAGPRRGAIRRIPCVVVGPTITGAASFGADGGEQRVQPADPGVAVSRALLGVPVDLDDRVVDVDQTRPVDRRRRAVSVRPGRRNRDATASSWRTCPKVNARRNEPSVEGAYGSIEERAHRRRGAAGPCHRCCRRRRPSPPPATSPSDRRWRPCRWALSAVHRPTLPAPHAGPTRPPGPARAADTRLGSSNSRPRRVGCEIVASTRCPSLWPNVILRKSHSPTTTGHFDVKTHSRPSPNRCIQVKGLDVIAWVVLGLMRRNAVRLTFMIDDPLDSTAVYRLCRRTRLM